MADVAVPSRPSWCEEESVETSSLNDTKSVGNRKRGKDKQNDVCMSEFVMPQVYVTIIVKACQIC